MTAGGAEREQFDSSEVTQPGVCFNVQWTEARLSLKGNCRLVRRKPERMQAGRRAGENEMTGTLQKTEDKPKKKKKKQIPRRRNEERAQLRFGETPTKINRFLLVV